jgi:radical SAM superfamily enzyme YgiQ (UPF0313 family)
MGMKILFVADEFNCDPLGIAWLSAYLEADGHSTMLHNPAESIKALSSGVFLDILCYSVTTGNHVHYREVNEILRRANPDAISVFGGPHVTFFPEYIQGELMDVGVRGEGFEAIVDVARVVEKGGWFDDIPNCVVDGKANSLRPLMPKERMLLPDRDIIYRENKAKPIKSIMTSFQCVHQCNYCFNHKWKEMYGNPKTQVRPVQDVMAEIDDLKRYPTQLLYFEDDVFPVYKRQWLDEFCDNYDGKLPFHIHLRAEYIKDDAIRRLKEAGLHSVTFAIESGDETLRRTILNRNMSDAMILRAASILHEHGVNFRTQNMVGIPYETWHTALKSLSLNIACQPTMGWASVYQPYPGTELGDLCIANGWFQGDLDSISSSFFDRYRLDVPHGKRYERLQKLFGFAVRHPGWGKSVVPLMARLPFRYKRLHNRYKRKLNRELYELDL